MSSLGPETPAFGQSLGRVGKALRGKLIIGAIVAIAILNAFPIYWMVIHLLSAGGGDRQ